MSKSSLMTLLALIASVSAKPSIYGYGTYPFAPYTAAEYYNPSVPVAYSAYSSIYPTLYSSAYSSYPSYAPASFGTYSAALTLPPGVTAYGSAYSVEEYAVPAPAVSSITPVASVSPVTTVSPASLTYAGYAPSYSYFFRG